MKIGLGFLKKSLVLSVMIAFLALALILSATVFAGTLNNLQSGAGASITYSFTGDNSGDAGYAQGTITVKATDSSNAGTYYLYWADDSKALDGYKYIDSLSVTTSGASTTMFAQTAVPAGATKLIAIKSGTEPSNKTVASASAVYNIPSNKQFPHTTAEKQYTFASYSDIHIANDSYGSGVYPYDEVHLTKAFNSAAARDVDFIVTSGDNVNNQNGSNYSSEWKTFQKILADSDYCNPIYETIGNHEIWTTPIATANSAFIKATGLDCKTESLSSGKCYYTFDEPITGDHFIVMALETNFNTNKYDEFSTEQINWVKGLLSKYKGDGHNVYIYEHANFYKWGAGDDLNTPYYDIPLSVDYSGNKQLQQILSDNTDVVFFCGHTHIQFSDQLNYVDYDVSSGKQTAKMVHNSSVGGIRKIVPSQNTMNRENLENETEGYFVDSYGDYIICNGANLYYNLINPKTTYIVAGTGTPGQVSRTTTTNTASTYYSVSYNVASSAYLTGSNLARSVEEGKAFNCTLTDNSGKTPSDTEKYTKTIKVTMGGNDITSSAVTATGSDINTGFVINIPSVTGNIVITASGKSEVIGTSTGSGSDYTPGDVNEDGEVNVKDATLIQKHSAHMTTLSGNSLLAADVNGDNDVNVTDATRIQKYVAHMISVLSSGKANAVYSSGASKSDLQTLMSAVGSYLSSKYTYSSYDQYMAVKKEYRCCNSNIDSFTASDITSHYNSLNEKYKALTAIAGEVSTSGTNTVYFKNTSNWSTVNAYFWTGGDNNSWPGDAMEKVSGNIYKISVDSKYDNIIFNDGSTQTGDLTIDGDGYIYDYSTKQWSKYTG